VGRWGAHRLAVVLTTLLAASLASCSLPAETMERGRRASAPSSSAPASTTPSPVPTASPSATVAAHQSGATAEVPTAVIMEQLARRAERIAKRIPLEAPTPADVDPGSNRALGYQLMLEFGFPANQWPYLDALWQRESGWNHLAENRSSGAYGIPQSLPASKMAVVGPDWRTNPETQIQWGLAYIAARYRSPQQAWQHSERVGWY
jgi:hypothetical protein